MFDPDLGPAARIRKFDELHGPALVVGGWLLFEDGAQREIRGGAMISPPDDPYKGGKNVSKSFVFVFRSGKS